MHFMSLLDRSRRPALACVLLLTALIVVGISCTTGEAPPADEKELAPAVEGFAPIHGDGKLYYQVRGEGHPVVLIHGGSTHIGMWDDQFDVLARHYRVVRYDVRGYGQSSSSQVGHSQWHDLRKLLEHLDIERTHIVGLSMGGKIAVDFALEDPEKVAHLVLAGPGLSGWQFEPAEWIKEIGAARAAGDGPHRRECAERAKNHRRGRRSHGQHGTAGRVQPSRSGLLAEVVLGKRRSSFRWSSA